MAEQAKVTSIEALEFFRAHLIVFLNKAHRSVDEVGDEVRRTRQWLQHEQRPHWEGQVRKWRKLLDQRQQDLLGARMSGLQNTIATREAAVLKARKAVAHAEEKLRQVKGWTRDFDGQVEPLTRRLESFRQFLDLDMPKGISYLLRAQRTLEGYSEAALPAAEAPAASRVLQDDPTVPTP